MKSKYDNITLGFLIFLPFLLSIFIGVYLNLFTTYISSNGGDIPSAIKEMGWYNVLILISVFIIIIQIYISLAPSKNISSIKTKLIERILETACKSLIYPKKLHIRAIITIADYKSKLRITSYSYNISFDPERTASYPLDFGVTGEAFTKRHAVASELEIDHSSLYADNVRDNVLPNLRTVLAVPIFNPKNPHGPLIGILAFDSSEELRKIKFDSRESFAIAQHWADIVGDILIA